MTWLEFTVACLSTYRLSLLVSKEDGPAYLFRKLRNAPPKRSSAHKGIRCLFCVSVYMSAGVTALLMSLGILAGWICLLYWLAFSAAAILMNQSATAE